MIRRSSPLRRTRMRRQGARALRELDAVRAFRAAVLARAGHRCERLCRPCHRATHERRLPDWRSWIRTHVPAGRPRHDRDR